jgi:hypothetical protein
MEPANRIGNIESNCGIMEGMVKRLILGAILISSVGCGGLGIPTTTVQLGASPTTIPNGQSSTLAWTSINASSVVSSNFGATTTSGTKVVSPTTTTIYTITVQSPIGDTDTKTVTVTVN